MPFKQTFWRCAGVTWGVLCALGCSRGPAPISALKADPAAAAKATETLPRVDGSARLSPDVVPLEYHLRFAIDPRRERFFGTTEIEVMVKAPTRLLRLHQSDLDIKSVEIISSGEKLLPKVLYGTNEGFGLYLSAPLSGRAKLRLEYAGNLTEVPMSLYRARDAGRFYAFTQFEPLAARGAFPCFDEPHFKTPYRVTINTPRDMQALSNAPLSERRTDGDQAIHTFFPTRPLPSYLVALAVGQFDVLDGSDNELGVPLRIVTTSGKGQLGRYAIEKTPEILRTLIDYFGSPYPYQKLDMLAVPSFSFGAMENAGLVTYRERILLVDAERGSELEKVIAQVTIAHELAHMWFGNLVTMKWWDDLWLNEAFATWMSNRVLVKTAPELRSDLYAVTSMVSVMDEDAQLSATPIRKRIRTPGDIRNAFDGITYQKGFAVLRMLENWVGEVPFKAGIRHYMRRHAWKNASQGELFRSLDLASQRCASCVAKSFVEQAGTPLIRVALSCEQGKQPKVVLEQQRYLPAERGPAAGESWQIPVCLKLGSAGRTTRQCQVLTRASATYALDGEGCPDFVHPNHDEFGYYRWHIPEADFLALLNEHGRSLSEREWVAIPSHAGALLEAGLIGGPAYLEALRAAGQKSERLVLEGVLEQLGVLARIVGDSPERSALQAFVAQLLKPHEERVGFVPHASESIDHALVRRDLFLVLSELTSAPEIVQTARETSERFLRAPTNIDASVAELHVPIAARHGDASLHARLVELLEASNHPSVRAIVVNALASFKNPALLRKSLELLLDGRLLSQDYGSLLWPSLTRQESHRVFWEFFKRHEPKLIELMGRRNAAHLPWVASGFCTPRGRREAALHFKDLQRFGSGAEQNLAQALEAVDRCITLRKLGRAEIVRWLAEQAKPAGQR